MRVAVTGSNGQLGRELVRALGEDCEVFPLDLPQYDVGDLAIVGTIGDWRPDLVVHAAAMTDVDGCARDPDAAYRVNALGTRNVALACQRAGATMVYVSTNEVFDGSQETAYLEFDEPHPINAYGRSKLAGERYVQTLLDHFYIVRTAWLYGHGGNHFVAKILRRAQELGELRVVTDEVGSPTYARDLAQAIVRLAAQPAYGIYHFTNAGACSRFEFAREILRLAGRESVPIFPITSREFVRASQPPPQSELRNFCGAALGIILRPWQAALEEYLHS